MIYNLHNPYERERFDTRVETLKDKECFVELTEKTNRTRSQNNYIHLIIALYACESGLSGAEAELVYKKVCNPDFYVTKRLDKFGREVDTVRHSNELTKEQMSVSIDRFLDYASSQGVYLPTPEDHRLQMFAEQQIERHRQFVVYKSE